MSPSVHVRDARVVYDNNVLFENLNFDLKSGEWTCLLGASGVGKTTLLKLVAGLVDMPVASATVSTDDELGVAGRVAWMAQQDLLLPWKSVLENVTLGATLRGETGSHILDRGRELLTRVGLGGQEDTLPDALSGGMRQRAALARTLMEDREITLMDEPFAAVDAITRYRLQHLAAELLADKTTLLVTHDPLEAVRLGHSIYVLSGRPAVLERTMRPDTAPVREPDDAEVVALQSQLLRTLAAAQEESA